MAAKTPTVKQLLLSQASRDTLIQQALEEIKTRLSMDPPTPASGATPVIEP